MDLTPQSVGSPASPDLYKPLSPFSYPSPVLSEANCSGPYHHIPQGLAIYGCPASESHSIEDSMEPTQDSELATDWTASALQTRRTLRSPNIFSSDPDHLSSLHHASMASSYSPSLYNSHGATSSVPSTSPALSCIDSNRSSISSSTSEPYPLLEHYHVPQPRIKMEEQLEWTSDAPPMLGSLSHADESMLIAPSTTFPSSYSTNFFTHQDPMVWGRPDTFNDNTFADSVARPSLSHPQPARPQSEHRKLLSSVTRTKAPRKMTTREDANFQCSVKGCGKLFSRSYNYKAHLETHSANREYPFPCLITGCTKKFVRKTDLQRHHTSVHEKTRNYQCDFCTRFFARKDTLRRHMEDGCSKRFDLNMSFNPSYTGSEAVKTEVPTSQNQMMNLQSPYATAGASSYTSGPSREMAQFQTDFSLPREDYGSNQGTSWGS